MDATNLIIDPQVVQIAHASDIGQARRLGKAMAEAVGFGENECEKLGLVISELGSNIIKHAGSGTIIVSKSSKGEQAGIQIESIDEGPGIKKIELAFEDGYSTAAGLGYGLGTVNRVMDEVDIKFRNKNGKGTYLISKRWLNITKRSIKPVLDIGAASRPHLQMTENGDEFFIKQWESGAFVAVIDGVGHGRHASIAAKRAVNYLEDHYQQSLDSLIKGLDRTCRSTRGIVLAMIRFNTEKQTFQFAGIGNIEIRSLGLTNSGGFISRRGIIGAQIPDPWMKKEYRWSSNAVLVLHTDGIFSRWRPENYEVLTNGTSAFEASKYLLRDLAKDDDDATVLVVKEGHE